MERNSGTMVLFVVVFRTVVKFYNVSIFTKFIINLVPNIKINLSVTVEIKEDMDIIFEKHSNLMTKYI